MSSSTLAGPDRIRSLPWWLRMARDPLVAYAGLFEKYGDAVIVPYRRGRPLLLLSRAEHVEHVLVSNAANYTKSFTYRPLQAFLGSGLLTSEGEQWRRHRRLIGPVFAGRNLDRFGPQIIAAADRMSDRWRAGDQNVDIAAQMRALTLDVIGDVLFGTSLEHSVDVVGTALGRVQQASLMGVLVAGLLPDSTSWSWLPRIPGVRGPVRAMDDIVDGLIAQRRDQTPGVEPRDLLDLLLAARAEDGTTLSDQEIHDEVLTLMVAGHETTSHALTWTLNLLARHEDVRRRVEEEVDQATQGRALLAEDYDRLEYTRAVINESMRLYPPAWTIERDAIADDSIAGIPVTAGTTVVTSPYLLHRNPEYWPEPERFDPTRFLGSTDRPRHAFLPFGAGARVCVGAGFAMFEATLLLAAIVGSYRVDPVDAQMPATRAEITLRPRGRVQMKVTPRLVGPPPNAPSTVDP